VTFTGNYIHHTSGRSPKLTYPSHWHAYNNYWSENTGHAFDVGENSNALIEGNVFRHVNTPLLTDGSGSGSVFAVTQDNKATCESTLGRTCYPNALTSSGKLAASDKSVLTSLPAGEKGVSYMKADQVRSSVEANAGVGKIGSEMMAEKVKC
jgi:pectin lyase